MSDNGNQRDNGDMSIKEMVKLFSALRKARAEELKALKAAWPNPTPRQAKRIEKLQDELEEFSRKHNMLRSIASFANFKNRSVK